MSLSMQFSRMARGENMGHTDELYFDDDRTERSIEEYEDKHEVQRHQSAEQRITNMENIIQLQTDKAKADFQAIENMQRQIGRLSAQIELLKLRVYALEQAADAQDHDDTIESNRPGLF